MQILAQLIVSGIAVGMIYGVIAFGYQLTFATSKTLNFGQGEALMLGSLVGWTLVAYTGYWIMLPIVLAFGMLQGAVVERLGVRQAMKTKSESRLDHGDHRARHHLPQSRREYLGPRRAEISVAAAGNAAHVPASTCCPMEIAIVGRRGRA